MTADSAAYYDRNAERFAADTGGLDMSALHERFLRHVRAGGRILDAGCGVGRDALAFADRGYSVVAFDASTEMVRLSMERTAGRAKVVQMEFDAVAWLGEFDGVWACASLLHVRATYLPPVIRRLRAALRPGGALYMSFKYGSGERLAGGRRFTDLTEETLSTALTGTGLTLAEVWVSGDVRAERPGERWINAVARRTD
jgi:SAM-dependent methyltransferase